MLQLDFLKGAAAPEGKRNSYRRRYRGEMCLSRTLNGFCPIRICSFYDKKAFQVHRMTL